jgi:exopolysaccharide biosynthesis protein
MKLLIISFFVFINTLGIAQVVWQRVDTFNMPTAIEVYYTNSNIDTNKNIAYYIKADVKNKKLLFSTDTTSNRRLTPAAFFNKNDQPLLVVNGTFFSFANNQNLNIVINNKKLLSYNIPSIAKKGKNGVIENKEVYRSAIGINKKRQLDIAWIKSDTGKKWALATQVIKDSSLNQNNEPNFKKWKMQTAIGGGPTLISNGKIMISNNFEQMFVGKKGLSELHPRTAMGYTADGHLIIMVVQGRSKGKADGVSLTTLARMLYNLGCVEALNLDGGGSSCMLLNGKQTIQPSDATGQRAIPAVFLIKEKK